ncbi:hypothetical protein [Flavobacterium collinsii]|uniref:Outer membrane protein beta-barrel domain-containing protein n=1 Tax=Flavobacterium collinsii TaxID=1114861 RepID=A0ABN7EPB9_9FLAO|nr:hypothetical protein [Flavobacterium collinsii]CAA9201905.1 hypothetical protein FLACOL7796_04004 [Flavobacterium collinsii]
MKTNLLIYLLLFGFISYGQVTTKNIIVDLNKPHVDIQVCKDSSCKSFTNCKCKWKIIKKAQNTAETDRSESGNDNNENKKPENVISTDTIKRKCKIKSRWLSIESRDLVTIKLANGNPLKYSYKIDTKTLSFFNDKNITAEDVKKDAKTESNETHELINVRDTISLKDIVNQNEELIKGIDSLNIEVESLYKILTQKNTIIEDDYAQRIDFLDKAKGQLKKSYELLTSLGELKVNSKSKQTKEELLTTKEKAEKSVDEIIKKFYTIDLNFHTLPIDVQGKNIDVVEFKLRRFDKITKDEDLDFAPTPYNIWIKGGFKIDVSAGLFFTSLYDSEFSTKDDPAISGNKIITLKNGGDYDLAFGSTINTYVRMNSWIVPTLNFGAVITQNQKLQILLGVGAILGKQERIIFSTGFSMGKVSRIADSYSVDGSYNLGNSGDVPTQNQFKFGHFFGITYNLTKVKKISLDKGIEQN